MAPEQLEGAEADARTDIFAFGALLYEMATGRRAFDGKSKTSLIAAILSTQPPPISSIQPVMPPALDHVVKKCLEKDPDDRWQSAHDVANELRWIGEAGSQAGVPARCRCAVAAGKGWPGCWREVSACSGSSRRFRRRSTGGSERPRARPCAPRSLPPTRRRSSTSTSPRCHLTESASSSWQRRPAARGRRGCARSIRCRRSRCRAPRAASCPSGRPTGEPSHSSQRRTQEDRGGRRSGADVVLGGGLGGAPGTRTARSCSPVSRPDPQGSGRRREPKPATTPTVAPGDAHRWPSFLPDGRHFLYLAGGRSATNVVFVASLDGSEVQQLPADSPAVYAPPGDLPTLARAP